MIDTASERFTITVSAGQAHILARACELLSRVHIGQLEQVGHEVERAGNSVPPQETADQTVARHIRWERQRLLTVMLRNLNPLVTGYESPGYRTDRDPDDAHAARDLEMAIRHALWRARPEGDRQSYTVDADPPRRTSKGHPLPQVLWQPSGAAGGDPAEV